MSNVLTAKQRKNKPISCNIRNTDPEGPMMFCDVYCMSYPDCVKYTKRKRGEKKNE